MSYQILPLEATDSDLNEFVRLAYVAFSALNCFYSAAPGDASFAQMALNRVTSLTHANGHGSKAIEVSTGRMVGAALWKAYPEARTEQEVEKSIGDFSPYRNVPEARPEAVSAFTSGIKLSRKEVLGTQAHVSLGVLVVHPDYQKRGIGKMLMQWGLDEADRMYLSC
jgi:GNAT superfamily N-acetyltransferase